MPYQKSVITTIIIGAICIFLVTLASLPGWLEISLQSVFLITLIITISGGADWLVTSSSRLAKRLGVSRLVIGLTVVAFGTSAPEMAASLAAGFGGRGDITIANVLGSNIFNLCFILGGAAIVARDGLRIDRGLIVRDGPVMLISTIVAFFFIGNLGRETSSLGSLTGLFDLTLSRWEGLIFLMGLAAYLGLLYTVHRPYPAAAQVEPLPEVESSSMIGDIFYLIVGLTLVTLGCHLMVGQSSASTGLPDGFGALWFATLLNIPDFIVGMTIIAAGTSAPELVVSLAAAGKGEADISTGNLLGSVVFNILGVLGISGVLLQPPLAAEVVVSQAVVPNLLMLMMILVFVMIIMFTGRRITRLEGVALVVLGIADWIFDFMIGGHL